MQRGKTYYRDEAFLYLDWMSKSALIDVIIDLLRLRQESADEPATIESAHEACEPILRLRGDRVPLKKAIEWRERIIAKRALSEPNQGA